MRFSFSPRPRYRLNDQASEADSASQIMFQFETRGYQYQNLLTLPSSLYGEEISIMRIKQGHAELPRAY